MGDSLAPFSPDFNGSLRIEGRPERLTTDAGAILLREVTEKVGIIDWMAERLKDPRNPELITHPLRELLRTMVLLLAQGWRDQDNADVLRDDPAFRLATSNRRGSAPLRMRPAEQRSNKNPEVPDGLASQPTLSRLFRSLGSTENRSVLREGLLTFASRRLKALRGGNRPRYLTLDVDSLPIDVYGHQPGSEYNGHYRSRIYHPLIAMIAETGDLVDVQLRNGNVHTASGAMEFILPLLDRMEAELCQVASVRMDAGFPEENLLAALEARRTPYVARVKSNALLDKMAEPYLRRPVGRPPSEPRTWFHELAYQAKSWSRERRVVLVVLERPGELFLHHFWLITNWPPEQMSAQDLLEMYRERGTAESHFGELKSVLDPALSSSPRPKSRYRQREVKKRCGSLDAFAQNEVILLLHGLAYNVLHAARVLMAKASGEGWSLMRLRERVLRTAGRVLLHARRVVLVIGESPAKLWGRLWREMQGLHPVAEG